MEMENITSLIQKWFHQFMYNLTEGRNNKVLATTIASATLLYMGIVRYMRYKNINNMIKKYPNPQQVLDDPQVAQEIFAMTMKLEFPFLSREGTELALFKTFTIPTISKILASTGQFSKSCPRRTEDTELILNEMVDTYARIQKQLKINSNTPKEDIDMQWKRPKDAASRLNKIHAKYNILNDDYIYTLSLFMAEPISWVNRYEWRELDEREINAIFRVWHDVGVAINIRDIPNTPQRLLDFKTRYASENIKYSPSNWKCGEPTIRHLLTRLLPSFLIEPGYKFSLKLLPSVLDPEDVVGFQLPYPESKFLSWTVRFTLAIRAFVIRHFMLPRSNFVNRTPFYANGKNRLVPEFYYYKPHIYEKGYVITELGPEEKSKKKNEDNSSTSCPFHKL